MTVALDVDRATASSLGSCSLDVALAREWLLTNGGGGFSSGTTIGCPTRRYHGLLIAAQQPPLGRHVLLSAVLERVHINGRCIDLSTFEFSGTLHPQGHKWQTGFDCDPGASNPWVRFTYRCGECLVAKTVTMIRGADVVRLAYHVEVPAGVSVAIELSPLIAMRHMHALRYQAAADPWNSSGDGDVLWVEPNNGGPTLAIVPASGPAPTKLRFSHDPVWWHNFRYRVELARGYAGGEDLQNVGTFRADGTGPMDVEIVAVALASDRAAAIDTARSILRSDRAGGRRTDATSGAARGRPKRRSRRGGRLHRRQNDPVRNALLAAADQFVVRCSVGKRRGATSIIAGYPWFDDWGRDALLSLEGLLLIPRRFNEARDVLRMFAGAQRNGLIPNRFDDITGETSYNSVDASLWYLHAADAFMRYTKDERAWSTFLFEACARVADAFIEGTDFDIGVNDRGLLNCGSASTQLTWMDAKVGDRVFTPRHGCPVEVNALWYSGLQSLLSRTDRANRKRAALWCVLLRKFADHFEPAFWNERAGCLYDCVRDGDADAAIRPNQILAVSLPHTPLSQDKQRRVVDTVGEHLLTPMGLRSLSPSDDRYQGAYTGSQYDRDAAYHNGTVWAWLIGPFVEAWLRVHGPSPEANAEGRKMIEPLLDHLFEACRGSISEVFDGDPPHHPRGCFAQAWSVAEVLRAYDLTEV